METKFKIIFRSLILLSVIMIVGCKRAEEKSPTTQDQTDSTDYEALQNAVADSVLNNNGAVIQLEIKNADSLFNSSEGSIIGYGSPDLKYIGMKSKGKPGDDSSTNDSINAKHFISSVYVGKQIVWMFSPRDNADYRFDFQEVDPGRGEKATENGTEPCNAFTIKRALPEASGVVRTQVIDDPSLIDCKQDYSMIFSIEEKSSGKIRYFILDPWVLIKP